ncbi:MAG TPA: dipeptidase [Chloroflexi bacterium]|jgi:acetylornithine deacetylase/succinyl-diaminopimelate desuccinylase-like protein|nr:dipeptidase [Chloroflexota bacterium]
MAELTDQAKALRQAAADHTRNIASLCELIRIPSVSSDQEALITAAEAIRAELKESGLQDVRLINGSGVAPYVFAQWIDNPRLPTVMLYAHYDVQPAGERSQWSSEPFVSIEREGRLYGRGAADDKGGVVAHIAAVRAWLKGVGRLPLNVKLLIEGEEEIGSKHFAALLDSHAELLKSDVVVIPDSMNWNVGDPSLTCSTRGAVTAIVELTGVDHSLHSGVWGGLAPDPVMGICQMLSMLVSGDGEVQLESLRREGRRQLDEREIALRGITGEEVAIRIGLPKGMSLVGDPNISLADRIWNEPCITVTGFDAPAVNGAPNAIQGVARARINLRLPPAADPSVVAAQLASYLERHTPHGLKCTVTMTSVQAGWVADLGRPEYAAGSRALAAAYERPVSYLGTGGTLPLLRWIAKFFNNPPCLVLGTEDPMSNAHGPDESLELADWHKLCTAQTLLLGELSPANAQF